MHTLTQDFRESIRHLKNDAIRRYYKLRINSTNTPYTILLKPNPYKILFVLSHMRSGSTLLTHLLVTNPEIMGFGETHIKYFSENDFKQLLNKVYNQIQEFRQIQDLKKLRMNHQYVLDKVLHDAKFVDESFLESDNIRSIFLIRDPKRTLISLLDLKPHWTEDDALCYYIGRLATLEKYAKRIDNKERSFAITHQQLLEQTNLTFESFQDFLKTKKGFSEKYEVLKTTGQRNFGDFKENIKTGRIIREVRKIDIQVSSETIKKAQQAFDQCCQTLSEYCRVIDA